MAVDLSRDAEDALLKKLRDDYDRAWDHWSPIHKNGAKNMRYVSGDPWEKKDRDAREAAGRPCLSLDEITQYTNQVINQLRAKRRAVVFSPNGRNASDKTAEFYQDKWREIEYRSKAQIVYTTGAQNAIERGYGFCRLKTKDVSDESLDQDIWLEEIVNPDSVLPDPDAKRPTFSDQQFCFVYETRKKAAFTREFPKARISDFSVEVMNLAPAWIRADDLILAEYWTITTKERERIAIKGPDGQPLLVWADELREQPHKSLVLKRRMKQVPKVCMYLTNGVEILEKTEWPGKYIPIAGCVGKVIYLDTGAGVQKKILSMVDLMRDPQMLNAYLRTNEAELVGMSPKTPWVGYTGQFRTRFETWQKLNHEPVAFIEADPTTEATGQQILPLPQRQSYEPPIQALEILAESSRRSIQAAAGSMPLPTAAQRRNEKSGVALKQMDDIAQVGSYHFGDHYDDMIEHVGVMGEDLMDKIYDTAREVAIRKANDTSEMVRINDPSDPKSVSTKGDHLVTVSTGPTFDSTREAVKELANTLITGPDPEVVRAVMPIAIKLMNLGAEADELIEIAEALQPPNIQALRQKDGEEPDPKQLMAQLAQSQQRLQLAEQAMQELAKEAEGKQLDAETKLKIADMQGKFDLAKARMDNATRISIAHISASAKGAALDAHAEEEAMALGMAESQQARQHAHEQQEAAAGREHDRGTMQQQADHEVAMTGAESDLSREEAEAGRAHEAQLSQAQLDAQAAQAAQQQAGA